MSLVLSPKQVKPEAIRIHPFLMWPEPRIKDRFEALASLMLCVFGYPMTLIPTILVTPRPPSPRGLPGTRSTARPLVRGLHAHLAA